MASPPTVTVGSSDGASTVATSKTNPNLGGNPGTLLNSANLTQVSGNNIISGSSNYSAKYINTDTGATLGAAKGWGVRCTAPATATMFDVCTRNLASQSFRVRVDGLWVQTADFTSGTVQDGGHYYYTKFAFGADIGGKVIEVYFSDGSQAPGLNFGTGAAAGIQPTAAPEADPINMIVYGNSYPAGIGPTGNSVRGSIVHKLAEKLGITNAVASGVGGTGLIATNTGASKTFLNRIADATRVNTPDIFCFLASLNDNGQGAAAVQAADTAFVSAIGAALPNSLIVQFGN
jgi:hypothetical protein